MNLILRLLPKFTYFLLLFLTLLFMGFIALYLAVGPDLPEVDSIREIRLQTPMRVYSHDEQLIAEFGDQKRLPITLDQVPRDFINALLATEDQRFYQHSGVDLFGVLRAVINLAVTGTKSQGASTITMLVARNYYLTREKRFSRKFTEMFLAWKIESELSKDEILELFLNKISFGHRAFGIGAASQVYYGTTLDKLSLAKLATLAGIPKGQSIFNPISNPEKAASRRAHVLGRMLAEGFIDENQYQMALAEPVETSRHGAQISVNAPYLAEMVRSYAVNTYGRDRAYNDGFRIYTTIDTRLQNFAQQAVIDGLEEYDRRHGYRGPEQQFTLTADTSDEQIEQWLNDAVRVSQLIPAIVISLDEQSNTATLRLRNNQSATLELDSLQWAREFVDENNQGAKITSVSQVLSEGDLIRIRQIAPPSTTELELARYRLAQLPQVAGSFVALNPDNGAIEALVGGYNFSRNQYNRVTQARRQLGSNIKPFVYSAAFAKNFTPASIINDMPIVEEDITAENFWRPKNDGDVYRGPTLLRIGLRHSKNTVSIRLIREIGTRYTKRYLEKIGFPGEHMPPYQSLALGSASFTPLEVVSGYAVLANGGYKIEPWFIDRVETNEGQIIFQQQPVQVCLECEEILSATSEGIENPSKTPSQANLEVDTAPVVTMADASSEIEPATPDDKFVNIPLLPIPQNKIAPRVIETRNRYLIDHILKDVVHRGTAMPTLRRTRSVLLKRNDLAGKTGTTNGAKDAWFSGYNARHVATAWVGFDDHSKKLGVREFGGRAALPIWQKFMEKALDGEPMSNHPTPEGIVSARIDPKTGLLATAQTQNPVFEVFRSENAPTSYAESPIDDILNPDDEVVDDESLF